MLGWLLASTVGFAAEPWTWEGRVGAQVDAGTRGLFELTFRRRDLSLSLFTNTLDVRWEPSTDRGRAWLVARVEPLLAGLFFARWSDGAPDEARSLFASSATLNGGFVRYLPRGFYAGLDVAAQLWVFNAGPTTAIDVPGLTPVLRTDALLGVWHPFAHLWGRVGTDWLVEGPSPHAHLTLTTSLPWIVRPAVTVRAGWAEHASDAVRTRLGGLNPYEVQLAGAVWSELWVEDYAALRIGPEAGKVGPKMTWSASVFADLVWADDRGDIGLGGATKLDFKGRWIELGIGGSPTLERITGPALSGWVRIGQDRTVSRRRTKTKQPPDSPPSME